jgi:hypothetical protein
MRLLLLMLSCLLLAGCPDRTAPAADASQDPATGTATAAPAESTPGAVAAPAPPPTSTPESAPGASPRETLDVSCKTDADCEVKDIGSCCGYYPRCVNVNARTDPAGVQADCQREGRMSICGFPAITGCTCNAGQCENVTGPQSDAEVPFDINAQPQ